MPIRNRFAELHDEIAGWRRDFHEHPELLFDVHRTAECVAEKLKSFGCDEVVTGIGRTGVVGIIRGSSGDGRCIGLRADMDALPIEEATGVAYASKTPGKMHACGHDGHTAMLLGAAKYLAETRNFAGSVAVIFQPAEEGGGGGREMVDDGMMDRFGIDEVYGLHNVPGRPPGSFAIRPGPFYASTDTFEIVVRGLGGHAAQPHLATDTTVIAAHVVTALQTIVSREVDPVKPAVVSVTSIESATKAFNVISETVTMRGTLRAMHDDVRELLSRRVPEIARTVAEGLGGSAEAEVFPGYPVVENHDAETGFAAEAARRVSGDCDDAPIYMWGEDFGYMLNARPGAYIHLGVGDTAPLHHPEYDFNDEVIPAGCSWLVEMAESRLSAG